MSIMESSDNENIIELSDKWIS